MVESRERMARYELRRAERDAEIARREGREPPVVAVPTSPGEQQLRRVGALLTAYMEKTGDRAYPFDTAGSVASLQKVVDSGVVSDPSVLVHPLSSDRPATKGAGGEVSLSERNTSYVIVPWKQGPRDSPTRLLLYEKSAYTRGGRYVLFVNQTSKFLPEREFQRLLREQTSRYGKKKRAGGENR